MEGRFLAGTLSVIGSADLVVVVMWGWIENKQADWWAAWGQWVGGIGSLAAAATAVWIAQRGWRLATIERREDLASRFRSGWSMLLSRS
jgi:O-antigen/teichoic acid export membrane protein